MAPSKVITTLQDRASVAAALQGLARSRTEVEGAAYMQVLAGYGPSALPLLLQHLGTPDPWVVRALGKALAQLVDRERAAVALRRAILAPGSSDRRRIVAMVLLDQFLGEPLDESLFAALGSPTEVAVRALLRHVPPEERLARLDYLSIIHVQQPPEIGYALGQFRAAADEPALAALLFFALDERESIAETAWRALGSIGGPAGLQALTILRDNVRADRRPAVERARRKTLLRGVPDEPLPELPSGSRVLISPLDGVGNRLLIFLFPQEAGYRGLHIFLDDAQGIRGAYELSYQVNELPPAALTGTMHPAPHPWEGILLLEGTWGYARQLLHRFLDLHDAQDTFCPLEYRFFCADIWGWSVPPHDEPARPRRRQPLLEPEAVLLLGQPFLASWFLESEGIYRAVQELAPVLARSQDLTLLLSSARDLQLSECSLAVCARYAARLRDTSEWLAWAGQSYMAGLAAAAAEELESSTPWQGWFAVALLQKGLLVALSKLQGRGPA